MTLPRPPGACDSPFPVEDCYLYPQFYCSSTKTIMFVKYVFVHLLTIPNFNISYQFKSKAPQDEGVQPNVHKFPVKYWQLSGPRTPFSFHHRTRLSFHVIASFSCSLSSVVAFVICCCAFTFARHILVFSGVLKSLANLDLCTST